MKAISDELYAKLVKILAQDEKVAAFKELVMAPTIEQPEENKESEEKE